METREQTEAREKKLVDDTKRLAQSGLRKLGINIQNPLAGLDAFGEPEYDEVNRRENWAGPLIKDISTDVLSSIAIGKVPQKSLVPKLPPRSDGGRMINITPKRANEIVTNIIDGRAPKGDLTDFTTGSLKPNSMFSPNYRPPNVMYSTGVNPNQMKLFDLPTDPAGKEALRVFSENLAVRSGYESMAKFKREVLNRWPQKDQEQLFRELWSNQHYQGYIEHLTAKGSHMDWYWDMKGKDRNAVDNVRILYNDNLKNLKDTVEKIVYGTRKNPGLGWQGATLENRLIVSFEDPQRKTKKLYSRQNPGDIIIKRAGNDQIIGNLGQYLDTLYPQDPLLKQLFEKGVSELGLTPAQFRRQVLTERIGIIIENSYGLPKNATKRKRYIKQFIDDDMVDLTTQYPFLRSKQSISEAMNKPGSGVTEADYDKRGQGKNPIPPLGDPKFTKGGPFPSKTEMMNIEKAKRKGYVQGNLMDFLQNLFPDE